jgi:hypothetical protein
MEGYMMRIMMPYVNMVNSEFQVNIPLVIEKVGFEATHHFESIIKISATPSVVDGDLYINLLSIEAGNGDDPLTLEGEFLSDILALVGDGGGFIQDGAFVVEDFYGQLDSETLAIDDIEVVGTNLRMYIQIVGTDLPLEEIQGAIQDVLGVLDNPEYADIQDDIDNVLDALLDPELDPEDVEEALTDLLGGIEDLTPEQQEALYDDMLEAMENLEDFDYEDLFNLIP